LRALKPSPLVAVLFLFILAAQVVFFSSHSESYSLTEAVPTESQSAFGAGGVFSIAETNNGHTYQIHWGGLILNFALTYFAAWLLANVFAKATRFRKPATAYGITAVTMIGIAFVVSIGISKSYWGYFFKRPPLVREAREITAVTAIVPVKTQLISPGKREFCAIPEYSFSDSIARAKQDPYYCLDDRLLIELQNKKLIPATPALSIPELSQLYATLLNSGALVKSENGYHSEDDLAGIVVDATDKSGARLVILALTGGSVSNDHRPYYELVFTGGTSLSLKREQHFFYDVAGIEGMEWYVFLLPLSFLSIMGGFVLLTLWKFFQRLAWDWRQKNPAAETAAGL
jgi:hypothetical protein